MGTFLSPLLLSPVAADVEIQTFFDPRSHIHRADNNQVVESDVRNLETPVTHGSNDVDQQSKHAPQKHEDPTSFSRNRLVRPTGTSSDDRIDQQNHKVVHRETRRNDDRNRKLKELP